MPPEGGASAVGPDEQGRATFGRAGLLLLLEQPRLNTAFQVPRLVTAGQLPNQPRLHDILDQCIPVSGRRAREREILRGKDLAAERRVELRDETFIELPESRQAAGYTELTGPFAQRILNDFNLVFGLEEPFDEAF